MTSAKLRRKVIPIIKEGEEIRNPAYYGTKPGTTCGFCSKKYSRREYLTTHLIGVHGKTEEEAKAITGLESKRNLVIPTTSGKTGPRPQKKTPVVQVQEEESEDSSDAEESNVAVQNQNHNAYGTLGAINIPAFGNYYQY
jgi:hypothetical protein